MQSEDASEKGCRIVVAGGGWWSQTRHIPQLHSCPSARVVAVIEPNHTPYSPMDTLLDMTALSAKYDVPVYSSVDSFLESEVEYDGVVICTSHATHHDIGITFLKQNKHILIEKPMTISVQESEALHALASQSTHFFQVNHSANWRRQTQKAKELIDEGVIGEVRQIVTAMGSPLQHLFEDPNSGSWTRLPNGEMSGFGWGQMTHTIAWILLVTGVVPESAFCFMTPSSKSGADIYNAGTIRCTNGCVISISGTATTSPAYSVSEGNDLSNMQTKLRNGKLIDNKIFGTEGMLLYSGDDSDSSSGSLSVSRLDGSRIETYPELGGFLFENTDNSEVGEMPESLASFVDACNGLDYWRGAPSSLGLLTVRTVDALYRSAKSFTVETI